jgi:hypothetical protein
MLLDNVSIYGTENVSRSISEVVFKATVSLSDGSSVTATSAKIRRRKGGLDIISGANDIVGSAIAKAGLFITEGSHELAIEVDQNGKKYVWATANVTVTAAKDINLGTIVLAEVKRVSMTMETSEEIDELNWTRKNHYPGVISAFMGSDSFTGTWNETTQSIDIILSADVLVGDKSTEIVNIVGTKSDASKIEFNDLLFPDVITSTSTDLGVSVLVRR